MLFEGIGISGFELVLGLLLILALVFPWRKFQRKTYRMKKKLRRRKRRGPEYLNFDDSKPEEGPAPPVPHVEHPAQPLPEVLAKMREESSPPQTPEKRKDSPLRVGRKRLVRH